VKGMLAAALLVLAVALLARLGGAVTLALLAFARLDRGGDTALGTAACHVALQRRLL
jgi:hypothetical protein